jgi:hypothetical protein
VWLLHFFPDSSGCFLAWRWLMTQAMTQMTQHDARKNGLRHGENAGKDGLFCTSMTQ